MTILLLSVVPFFVCCFVRVEAYQFEFVACFDTKCLVKNNGSENIVRYKDCELSIKRVVFCNNEQYCEHNSMTGKGMCLNNPTEPPPTTVPDSSRLTAEQKLALLVSLPLLLLILIVVCGIIFWCYMKHQACFKIKKPNKVLLLPTFSFIELPSFIELDSVVKSISQKSAEPLWLQNYANFYESNKSVTNDKNVIAHINELDKEKKDETYDQDVETCI